ncbi:MAG TPA: HAD family hydrolase [Candidatus Saccharimonadales bacterium]|nr:HAD family hydrolase [Candidatus Saccharimonadales bacterium]
MVAPLSANIESVIWDLDGTILDSFGILTGVLGEVLPRHGITVPPDEEIAKYYHGTIEESIRGILGKGVGEEDFQKVVADFLVLDNAYIQDVNHHLFADAINLATRLHKGGVTQIVVTNRAHGTERGSASPRHIIQNSRLKDYIDFVICGDDGEYRKPNPSVLGALLEDLDRSRTIVIGDQFVDAQFASNIGARAILVQRAAPAIAHLEKLGNDWRSYVAVVSSLNEVQN